MSGETVKRGNFEAYTLPDPQMANFHTAIYEGDYDGLLIALCNQNGAHPWQINAILAGLNGKNEAADLLATERAAREKAEQMAEHLRDSRDKLHIECSGLIAERDDALERVVRLREEVLALHRAIAPFTGAA